jgi:signal peptidase
MVHLKRSLSWLGQVVAWTVIVAVAASIVVSVLVPRIGGGTPYTILTGSMRPTMPPGTLVVTKPVPPAAIKVGDVVTYQLGSGEPTVVTHRVVGIGIDGKGNRLFTTQGDANHTADSKPVMAVQIRGVRWYYVPYLGYATTFVTGQERRITTILVVSGLLLYAAWMFTSAVRDRRIASRPRVTTGWS